MPIDTNTMGQAIANELAATEATIVPPLPTRAEIRILMMQALARGIEANLVNTLALGDLANVDLTGASAGYSLAFNGTAWVPTLISGGSGGGDMTKLVYDSNDDGTVNAADAAPWAGITGKPPTFPPDAHNHDDLYYTTAEVDLALAGKADASTIDTLVALAGAQTITGAKTFSAATYFGGNIEQTAGWFISSAGTRMGLGGLPNVTAAILQVYGDFDVQGGSLRFRDALGNVNNVFYPGGTETFILRNFGTEPSTLFEVRSKAGNPTLDDREATIALTRTDDAGNDEFLDLYNNGYHGVGAVQYGIRIQKRGTGQYRPFVFDWYDGTTLTPGATADFTTGFTFEKNVTAPAYKVPGGTSSGFLKADGSIDTTAYATGSAYTQYVTVSASRDLTESDHGKTLRATGTITLTAPTGLTAGFRCDILNVGTGIVTIAAGAGATLSPGSLELDNTGGNALTAATVMHYTADAFEAIAGERLPEAIMVALGDETSDMATGAAKVTLHMPYAFLLTSVRFGVNEAPTGSAAAFDVNVGGVSILSTTATIDAGETTTATAAIPPVISNGSIADAAVVTFDIDAVGSTTPGKGPKAYLYGYRL